MRSLRARALALAIHACVYARTPLSCHLFSAWERAVRDKNWQGLKERGRKKGEERRNGRKAVRTEENGDEEEEEEEEQGSAGGANRV